MGRSLFTSESVTEGHPDKICDQISDAILDAFLQKDHGARVACEVAVTTGMVLVMGEISSQAEYIDIPLIVRKTLKEIGYTRAKYGFDADTCAVLTSIHEQSPDIAQGVNTPLEKRKENINKTDLGAGDQGLMFGFASDETPEYMPAPIAIAHRLSKKLTQVRKDGTLAYLRPDGKTQVTIEYVDHSPVRVDTVLISAQHAENISQAQLEKDIRKFVINPVLDHEWIDQNTRILINPTGRFVIGGPQGDAGLTGRKIMVDTYGGYARHGGGAFSGKDPTKVDRSAAYMARYIAKNIVAAKLAKQCEIQLAYAIGVANPVSIQINTYGTGTINEKEIILLVRKHFDLTPAGMIQMLNLRQPIYRQTASYGHFGRTDLDLPWERLDMVSKLLN